MKKHLLISTRNKDKRREISKALGENVELHHPEEFFDEDVEETGVTLYENALLKARAGFEESGLPSLADDTGLEVDALDGRPGVYSSRYAGEDATYEDNVNKLLEELNGVNDGNRTARFRTVMVYIDKEQTVRFDGVLEGRILTVKRGENGFGYDPVFLPENSDLTLAEIDVVDKNKISHRGLALQKFAHWYSSQG